MSRLWEKGLPLDARILRYTAGEDHTLDTRLVPYDIRASIAHAEMLVAQNLITDSDGEAIVAGLNKVQADFDAGHWQIELEDEDAHTAIENQLIDAAGEAGRRVHLGRSRNDQLLVALRLYMRDAAETVADSVSALCEALTELSRSQGHIDLPGTTHMQHAMPSSVAMWSEGYHEAFTDARDGLLFARRRINKNPLGSAAGYGTPGLDIDRDLTTRKLGFAETQRPATAVQLSRGKAETGLLFELTLLTQDLGRLATDLLLYYTQEYRYVSLPADITTGSSIMPQKRNPDVLELVRAAGATVQANFNECLLITSKLPSGFQRDLQRTKPPLFRGIDLCTETVEIMTYVLSVIKFLPENIRMTPDLSATEEAYRLVSEEGIPFRDAYRKVAEKLLNE